MELEDDILKLSFEKPKNKQFPSETIATRTKERRRSAKKRNYPKYKNSKKSKKK